MSDWVSASAGMSFLPSSKEKQTADMQENHFDVIVLGVGSMGSSTCYHLAKRGAKVLGLEQFGIPHERGEHGGQSRLIRKAYFEHPDYVPLLEKAYANWDLLEKETGQQVYHQTGLLYMGEPDHPLIAGVRTSAATYGIAVDTLTSSTFEKQYPQFAIPSTFDVLFEPEAGFLEPEKAIRLLVAASVRCGATIRENTPVISWRKEGSGIVVETAEGSYYGDKLVVCAGPWSGKMLPGWGSQLTVTRQVLAWASLPNPGKYVLGELPCWTIAMQGKPGIYYGFPVLDDSQFEGPAGFKLAHHAPGLATDPDGIDLTPNQADEDNIREFLEQFLPGMDSPAITMKTCRYTNTADEHFILDHLPGYGGRVIMAAGFSGHGFKFVSVVGDVMADLAQQGSTQLPVDFLTSKRLLS
jgi:sarcosine oxidase